MNKDDKIELLMETLVEMTRLAKGYEARIANIAKLAERRKDRYTTSVGVELHCQEISPNRTMQDFLNLYSRERQRCIDEGGSEFQSNPDKNPTLRAIAAVIREVNAGWVEAINEQGNT